MRSRIGTACIRALREIPFVCNERFGDRLEMVLHSTPLNRLRKSAVGMQVASLVEIRLDAGPASPCNDPAAS